MAGVLSGRIAVITAAASGMGREAALLFAREGAQIVGIDIDEPGLQRLADDAGGLDGAVEPVVADMTDLGRIEAAVADIGERHGGIDVLYNHAGSAGPRGFEFTDADWDFVLALNLRAPVFMTKAALPLMRERPHGASILFTSSASGLVASVNSPVYSAVKSGVIGFMRGVAAKCGPDRIRANAICPGVTETPMLKQFFAAPGEDPSVIEERLEAFNQRVPLGRPCAPEEVAELALFLASERSSYITGAAIPIDGGYVAV